MPPPISSTATTRRLREQTGHDHALQLISKARPEAWLTMKKPWQLGQLEPRALDNALWRNESSPLVCELLMPSSLRDSDSSEVTDIARECARHDRYAQISLSARRAGRQLALRVVESAAIMTAMAAVELLIGLACLAGSVVAVELLRRYGLKVLAGSPDEFRDRAEVHDRYATLNEHTPWGPTFVSLVRARWTLAFVLFFGVLAVADFDLAVVLLTAGPMALIWASRDFDALRSDERAFQDALGVEPESQTRLARWRIKGIYRGLHLTVWFGWIVGSALVGSGIGNAIG